MQVDARAIVGALGFCFAMGGVIVANMIVVMMIGEINRKNGEGDRISYWGYTPAKTLRIFRDYRNSYPDGRLFAYFWVAFAFAAISAIVFAISFRIV